jgi:hypothetical protein
MFDIDRTGSVFAAVSPPPDVAASPVEPHRVPLERVEAQICELAGHLAAATCRFLVLLADFDARRGWASWEMNSCAQWLSWKCQMSSGTAREHVRVARALRELPVIRARFAAATLSYAKVRALTRIATPATEAGLAGPMTANQLERFARAHRQVTAADDAEARVRRRLAWRFEEDGSLSGTFRLPPLQGAVLLKALRAACAELAGQAGDLRGDVSAETPAAQARAHVEDGPPLPEPDGPIDQAHDADITPDTIIPPWYGERLDLNHAIWACFANARTRQEREQDGEQAARGRVTVYEPEDCDERYRQYLEHTPRCTGPTLIPIQV